MLSPFVRFVAFRYLKPSRKEGFFSFIAIMSLAGITLGVAILVIVMAVMNGFREELINRILGLQGHLGVYGFGGGLTEYDDLAGRLRGLDGVERVAPTIEGQALVSHRGTALGVAVRGVAPEDFLARPAIAENLVVNDPADFGGTEVIAVGITMAQRLGLRLGDELTLISPQGNATAFGTTPRMRAYEIAAIFDVGMHEYNSSFVYMPLEAAQILYRLRGQVSSLEIFVDDPEQLDRARATIQPLMGGQARLWDWQQSNASFVGALKVERNVMFLILTAIVIVATFNIVSGLVVLVRNKGPDIAILRTMGATSGMVMRIFLLTGASIGVVGTILGLALGVTFSLNIEAIQELVSHITGTDVWNPEIRFLTEMPAKVQWSEVISVTIMALGLSFAATLYPSWRASRLDPVEALRYE
ncbi:MAG: lipoprotein-releasing ABC transporter permease subunit [Inquilinus sp.]|nr:lipoprotein-releasing ABC transporter permease subunit [Inquilinus sp.]